MTPGAPTDGARSRFPGHRGSTEAGTTLKDSGEPRRASKGVPCVSSLIDEVEVQIMEYLAGRRTIFELPIRLHGTDFQRHVWHVLTDINYGCATTYGMLALMAGCEGGSRAVGSAVGANPLHVIIPCHRVVEKSGRIGGYAGGGAVKFELLAREGKVVSVNAVPGRGFTRLIADAIPKVMG